jgi:hypothetical protein
MSLLSGKLRIHGCNEHDSGSAGDSTALSSRTKFVIQKQGQHEENSRMGNYGSNSGNDSLPVSAIVLKEMNRGHQILSDDRNASLQLKEALQVLTDESQVENSKSETVTHSSVSSFLNEKDLEDEKELEEITEEIEQSEIVSVLEEDIQEEEQEHSELNSIIHNDNSGTTINELLNEKPESESAIHELRVSKQESSVQEIESAEEVESIPEEVTEHITEAEEHRDQSETLKQDLEDVGQQSGSLLDHSEEGIDISDVVSSQKDSVEFDTHSKLKYAESDDVEGDILEVEEEEVENLPETDEGISHSEEHTLKVGKSDSLNFVSKFAENLFQKGFQEAKSNCDISKVKKEANKEISEKVEKITAAIFQKLLNESLKTFCKKDTKYDEHTLEQFNRNEYQSQGKEETGKDADLTDQILNNNYKNDKFMTTEKLNKQNEDKNVDRVDNITNAILEELLVESSAYIYSKKSKIDGSANVHEDLASAYEEGASIGDGVAGN